MRLALIDKVIFTDDWEMYFENPTQDYFNIKKEKIKLIISSKKGGYLRHVPDNYTPPDITGFGIIRGYNCQGRCYYCYLQSYFKSPDMVKFFNIEDYINFLGKFLEKFFIKYPDKKIILYDGDFQDSLGYAYLTKNLEFIEKILKFIKSYDGKVKLEIRTKQIIKIFENHDKWMGFERLYGRIFKKEYRDSLIVAITFSPQIVIDKYERGTADLTDRINFAKYVQDKGFFVGPRLDPIILDEVGEKWYKKGFDKYLQLIKTLQNQLRSELISDWGVGLLRLKKSLYRKLFQEKSSLINNLIEYDGSFYRYPLKVRKYIYDKLNGILGDKMYVCMDI